MKVWVKIGLKFFGGVCFITAGIVAAAIGKPAGNLFAPVLAGLLFGMAGDFLLAAKDLKPARAAWFVLGGIAAFFIGHLCYIVLFARLYPMNYEAIIAVGVAAVFILLTKFVGKFEYGPMLLPCAAYCVIVVYVFVSACFAFAYTASAGTGLLFAGASLFLVSDGILAFIMFWNKGNKKLMGAFNLGTYFPAQLLIALSLLFL